MYFDFITMLFLEQTGTICQLKNAALCLCALLMQSPQNWCLAVESTGLAEQWKSPAHRREVLFLLDEIEDMKFKRIGDMQTFYIYSGSIILVLLLFELYLWE